jgi:hypothetical protein
MPAAPITGDTIALLQLHDLNVKTAERAVELAKERREQVRARLRRRLPDGQFVDVADAGVRIRRKLNKGGRNFSLEAYERAHGSLTPEIAAIVRRGKGAEMWTIEDLDA